MNIPENSMEYLLEESNINSTSQNIHQVLNQDKYQANLGYIQSLKFLKNKEEVLQIYNPNFGIAIAEQYIIAELEKRKITYSLDSYGRCLRIFSPHKAFPQIIYGINFGLNPTSVVKVLQDKILTNEILRQDGFNLPREYILEPKGSIYESAINNYEGLCRFIKEIGFPLIMKPNTGQRGKGITLLRNFDDVEDFYKTYTKGNLSDNLAVVQEKVNGTEYRVIYCDGEILLAYKKQPLTLIGDGENTLGHLLNLKNLEDDDLKQTQQALETQGYSLSDIPGKDNEIQPYAFINDLSEQDQEVGFTQKDQNFLKKIAKSFGAKYFGLDIISEGPIHQGKIIELNAKPDVLWATTVSPRFNEIFWSKIIDSVLQG